MEIHIRGGLIIFFYTLYGFFDNILPWKIGGLWGLVTIFMWHAHERRLIAWRMPYNGGGALVILKEYIEP
jgi:hypothetical protein